MERAKYGDWTFHGYLHGKIASSMGYGGDLIGIWENKLGTTAKIHRNSIGICRGISWRFVRKKMKKNNVNHQPSIRITMGI